MMFPIYINDLVALLTQYDIKVKLFAHNAKLYVKIVNGVDIRSLQVALSALCNWAAEWQLGILCVYHIHHLLSLILQSVYLRSS